MTTDTVKGSSPYFPYVEHSIKIRGIDYKSHNDKIERLQRKLNRRVEELIDLVEEINDYMNNIDDSLIRRILTLRYINGLTWEGVAMYI
ncbi:hypothetical protein KQI42_16380 [Tissierella sp. MSJ-40]|uniref:RNA polymerase sigma-70 region 4 domain-containing protein n=1 Tax=Tissierella simiarum TaxID=2841534 RepID=A0ABS6E9I2_9FIRM|nr:hypothetical protein [Tissierella simiarum]MBU5439593.1 hypothetical protein [Tissierella simiarum]